MSKLPYMALYGGEWMKDPAVRKLSPAARGIWIDALVLMHEDHQSGVLSGTVEELSRATGSNVTELEAALGEFARAKTCDISKNRHCVVTLKNRRMFRDATKRKNAAKRQQKRREAEESPDGVTPMSRSCHGTTSTSASISSSSSSLRAPSEASKRPEVATGTPTNGHHPDADGGALGKVWEQEGQIEYQFRRTVRLIRPSAKPDQRKKDLDTLAKFSVLAHTTYGERWLADGIEAVRNARQPSENPLRHLYGVLRSKAKDMGRELNRDMAKTKVPEGVFDSLNGDRDGSE